MLFFNISQGSEIHCICGGDETTRTEFIFRAKIIQGLACAWKHTMCRGTLISTSHVLTAGHCIHEMHPKKLMVIVGGIMQNGSDGVMCSVGKLIVHEEYDKPQ